MKTSDALQQLRFSLGNPSTRAMCRALGLPEKDSALVSRVLRGREVSVRAENRLRAALGLPPLIVGDVVVPACPDCGSAHHARCHGQVPAKVVVLASDQRVSRVPRRNPEGPQCWRPKLPVLPPDKKKLVVEFALSLVAERRDAQG